jgi:VIT1/CCC1 family predicted Fe2+/Mn2+ transporter
MPPRIHRESLETEHTTDAVARRLAAANEHSYVGDFILGAIDGTVTTFAVVAGAAGAEFSANIAIVLGMANLVADGFSMAASNYIGTKSERQIVERVRAAEHAHIQEIPEGEREEIRQIFAAKGFDGDLLERIVDVITSDERRWVDTMVTEEHGLQLDMPSPLRAALSTFAAFVLLGFIPLVPYCIPLTTDASARFAVSALSTAVAFFLIGAAKGYIVHRSKFLSGLETLAIGGAAAGLAYLAGDLLHALAPAAGL